MELCETDWVGVGKDIKEILKSKKKSSAFNFNVTSWFLQNIRINHVSTHSAPLLETS